MTDLAADFVAGTTIPALAVGVSSRRARTVTAGNEREPGQAWSYYNGNYFLAGAILAEVAGSSCEEALGWDTPATLGSRTVRVEVFVDDPDAFIERAVTAGADGSIDPIRDHEVPWGVHRQGGFIDPFGHLWLVGDRSPLGPPNLP